MKGMKGMKGVKGVKAMKEGHESWFMSCIPFTAFMFRRKKRTPRR